MIARLNSGDSNFSNIDGQEMSLFDLSRGNRYKKNGAHLEMLCKRLFSKVVFDNLKNYWEAYIEFSIFHNCLYARLNFDLLQLALNMKVQQKSQTNLTEKRNVSVLSALEEREKLFPLAPN